MTIGTTTRRIAFFNFGKGSGDLVIGIAIANAFRRAGLAVDFTAVTDNEFPSIANGFINVESVPTEPRRLLIDDRATSLYKALTVIGPELLIVYGSWLPVYPFLDDFPCARILLMRQTNSPWLDVHLGGGEHIEINPDEYDLAFNIEPSFEINGFEHIPPIVMRNRDEVFSRDEARSRLSVPEGKKLAVIARNGYPGELEQLLTKHGTMDSEYHLISSTNQDGGGIFPLVDYARGIDLLVSGGGYSTFYETRYFEIPAFLFPFDRNAEDIEWRLQTNADFTFEDNGADTFVTRVRELTGW